MLARIRSVVVVSDAPPAAPSFPSCRKRRGRKGALGYGLVRSASEFRREPMFQASFHTIVTSRASWYAPPDTGVPNLQLVALEYLQSIEGAGWICWSAPFCGEVFCICTHQMPSPRERRGDFRRSSGFPYEGKLSPEATDEVDSVAEMQLPPPHPSRLRRATFPS